MPQHIDSDDIEYATAYADDQMLVATESVYGNRGNGGIALNSGILKGGESVGQIAFGDYTLGGGAEARSHANKMSGLLRPSFFLMQYV